HFPLASGHGGERRGCSILAPSPDMVASFCARVLMAWRIGNSGELGQMRSHPFLQVSSTPNVLASPSPSPLQGAPPMNHLPNRGHPERREGSLATETQSKDPVEFTIDVPLRFHRIL